MLLYYPADRESALNILRAKLSLRVVRRDASGGITCYADRELAFQKAIERRQLKAEMFLVVIEVANPGLAAELRQERQSGAALARWSKPEGTVILSAAAQDALSEHGHFSLEIVPGTEDWLATYGNRAPECGLGIGPWK